jgi:anti-anti-sigma factor
MEIDISVMDDVVSIALKGRIDASGAPDVERKLLSLLSGGSRKLVADLSKVAFISSAGLKALLVALKESKRVNGDLRLAGIPAHVQEVLDLTGFSTIFKLHATVEDAAQSFRD